jgi:cytidylate kinase
MRIAIDGPSGAGKSTIAKGLANSLGFLYIDTGAMYRAVAFGAARQGIDWHDCAAVEKYAGEHVIDLVSNESGQEVFLDGEPVTDLIRTPEMSSGASLVSAYLGVREVLVARQQAMAAAKDVVMDGRDIGTHVLPDAELKIFLTATPEERSRRRYLELCDKGVQTTQEQVLKELMARDHDDSTRQHSPLRRADDAVELDSTKMSISQVIEAVEKLASAKK